MRRCSVSSRWTCPNVDRYYLLYGDNIKAFPQGFRMIAGDTFQRNFTWPIPDPPKSLWVGEQSSQRALRQKALGFNCLNYNKPSEPSLYRHYMPDKDYLDENCPDGLRFEVMFPSCWNGKDVDSPDHKSHMAYPSLVMDGECPEGFETRLVSLFYETIWNTHAFKGMAGKFVLANGDPTGFGYHGDFMQGWDAGVLQQAVDKCTNPSGEVTDCPVFDLQSQDKMEQCHFKMPDVLKNEDVYFNRGLPGGVKIESGPAYAFPIEYTTTAAVPTASPVQTSTTSSTSLSFDVGNILADGISTSSSTSTPTTTPSPTSAPTTTSISTPTPTPTPATSYIEGPVTRVIIQVQREIIVETDCEGNHITTVPGDLKTVGTSSTIVTETVSTAVTMETPSVPEADADAAHAHKRAHRHGHGHAHLHRRGNMV